MQAKKYLHSLEKFGINLGLERITYLLEKLDNPHRKFKSLHIAGTNGKGSTAAMTASILKEAGHKIGLYTSPHLFDYRERIKINGRNISSREFAEGLKIIKTIAKKPIRLGGSGFRAPTVFEALTAVAFWYFAKEKVDYAVVEVGLGGRLDATNVLTPLVSVITNIDYEHTEVLGKTLAKIAQEKAAIIKPAVPVVTAEGKKEPLGVIEKTCREKGCRLMCVEPETELLGSIKYRKPRSASTLLGTMSRSNGLFAGFQLQGPHQKLNASCALSAILLANIKVSKKEIKEGLRKVKWPGRFQIVSKKPLIIVDGAHNPAGIRVLRVTIEEMFAEKFTVIFGCQKTKDYKKMLQTLRPIAKKIIITRSSHQQAAELKDACSFKQAFAKWDRKMPLLITGSLFLAADALNSLTHNLGL